MHINFLAILYSQTCFSGQWPEAESTNDMDMPFKDARSFMSEMPVEREVSNAFLFFHMLTFVLLRFTDFTVRQNWYPAKLLPLQL
jgi:hypothetical protein